MDIELYAIKLGKYNLIYAPTARKVAMANDDACRLVKLCSQGHISIEHPGMAGLLSSLNISREEVLQQPVSRNEEVNEPWAPSEVTLSITSRCSLRCIYCYANGGDENNDMPWTIAQSAMDWVIDNAKNLGKESTSLHFHGEGEPTCNWPTFVRCVEYFSSRCKAQGLKSKISMSSNCWFSAVQREYVIANIDTVSASFDGSPFLQNSQRPVVGGNASSEKVIETLKEFDRRGFNYAIRATVIPEMFKDGMVSAVRWIADNLGCKEVRFEPVQPQGRGGRFINELDCDIFLYGFMKAREEGAKKGINIDYSVCDASQVKDTFCGALGKELNFLVVSSGVISTCNDVLKPSHEKSPIFHIGSIDPVTGAIRIDEDKLNWLRKQSVGCFSTCKTCFARWHCGGDCLARKPGSIDKDDPCVENDFRCTINRQLVLNDLFMLALSQNEEAAMTCIEDITK